MDKHIKKLIPPILYKYAPADTAIKILSNQTIRFTNPKCFNDPYDSNLPIILENPRRLDKNYFINILNKIEEIKSLNEENIINPLWSNIDTEKMKEILQKENSFSKPADDFVEKYLVPIKENMRVLSLSETFDNILMWGHYAQNNTGIVIGFDTSSMFFQHALKILYKSKIPKISNLLIDDFFMDKEETLWEIYSLLNTKSTDWKYEKEWRIAYDIERLYNYILYIKGNYHFDKKFIYDLKNQENFIDNPISPSIISEIYIGAKTNIIAEHEIKHLAIQYPQAKVFKMELCKTEFKLLRQRII